MKRKPNGFYKNMSIDELVNEVEKTGAEGPGELNKKSTTLYNTVRKRNIDGVPLMNILFPIEKRMYKQKGFYSKMSNDEILLEVKKYSVGGPSKLNKTTGALYNELIKRENSEGIKLVNVVFPINTRLKKPNGFYSLMSDDDLIKKAKNYDAKGPTELSKQDGSLCHYLRKRKNLAGIRLIDVVYPVNKRVVKPTGYYSRMSNEDLLNEAKSYDAKTPTELARKAGRLAIILSKIKDEHDISLMERLFSASERKRLPERYYDRMTDDQLIEEVKKENVGDRFILRKINRGLCLALNNRKFKNKKLMDFLFPNDSVKRPKGLYSKMSNEQLLEESKRYIGKSMRYLSTYVAPLYKELKLRKDDYGIRLIDRAFPKSFTSIDSILESYILNYERDKK